MRTAAKLLREAGQIAFIAAVITAMALAAVLCGIAKEECPL
jgi:hypothetical protein